MTTVKEELSPLSVTGIPAYAGTAIAELTPGTISNRIPASASACASSPPLPNTKGSPPFSRTTTLPARAAAIMRSIDLLLLPIAMRSVATFAGGDDLGLRSRMAQEPAIDEIVVNHDVGFGDAFASAQREKPWIARACPDEVDEAASLPQSLQNVTPAPLQDLLRHPRSELLGGFA